MGTNRDWAKAERLGGSESGLHGVEKEEVEVQA